MHRYYGNLISSFFVDCARAVLHLEIMIDDIILMTEVTINMFMLNQLL